MHGVLSETSRRSDLRRTLAGELRSLSIELVLLTQAIADRFGLNATDLQCLSLLTSAGPMTAGELAERIALTTGAVTGVIDRLERAGLVSRTRDPADRRRVIVQPLAEEELSRRAPELDAVFGAIALGGASSEASYTDDQLELFIDYLRRRHPVIHNQTAAVRGGAGAAGEASAPLGNTTAGHLLFARGVSHAHLDTDVRPEDLYAAQFEGTVPEIDVDGGSVTVRYRRFGLFEGRPRPSRFGLSPSIPWDVGIRGGIHRCTMDLRRLLLRSFEVRGGVSELELDLAPPAGTVPLRIVGGISKLTVRRPSGSPLTLQVRGGVSKLMMDDQEFGSVGGQLRLNSRDDHDGPNRHVLEITGGASRLTIGTH